MESHGQAPHEQDPTVPRRRVRSELRQARDHAGFTQRDVAQAMDWSLSKLIRIEAGDVGISTNDLHALLTHYGISDPGRVEELVGLARAARQRSPWGAHRDVVSREYLAFLGYESSASVIRNFEPLLVPGLLQTEEYAREVVRTLEDHQDRHVNELVDLRMERQELLARQERPDLHFIIDEAVIHRIVGGPDVMRRQLRHLQELSEQPNITIRVVPFTVGLYPYFRVPYVHFEFASPTDQAIVFVEDAFGAMIIREDSPEVRGEHGGTPSTYLSDFWQIEQFASRDQAQPLLEAALNQLPENHGDE